jgi:hypothetical protein
MNVGDTEDFARREIEGFFRRRGERGKFYCASCLATQLTERGAQGIFPATWTAAIEDLFERPGALRIESSRRCDACQRPRPRPCIGAPPAGP